MSDIKTEVQKLIAKVKNLEQAIAELQKFMHNHYNSEDCEDVKLKHLIQPPADSEQDKPKCKDCLAIPGSNACKGCPVYKPKADKPKEDKLNIANPAKCKGCDFYCNAEDTCHSPVDCTRDKLELPEKFYCHCGAEMKIWNSEIGWFAQCTSEHTNLTGWTTKEAFIAVLRKLKGEGR